MGEADREFRGTLVCWMASWDPFLEVERVDVEFVMAHESLFHKAHLNKNTSRLPSLEQQLSSPWQKSVFRSGPSGRPGEG